MQTNTINAVNAMLSDHITKDDRIPPIIIAMDVLYLVSLAAEYLKHIQHEIPNAATRLKGEILFLRMIYDNFNQPSIEIIHILKYFEQIHQKILDAVIRARSEKSYNITLPFIKKTINTAFKKYRLLP